MPVTVRQVDLNDRDQFDDLVKIYSDGPHWMRRDLDGKDFTDKYIRNCDSVWGGWFNGRIIGAVGVRETDVGHQLIGLCVRSVTRGRGVGRQILDQVLQQLDGPVFIETRQQASTDLLFDRLGFAKTVLDHKDGGITWVRWRKEPEAARK